jgi:PAS domain S-box-containing protein
METILFEFLFILDLVVMKRCDGGTFQLIGKTPEWFSQIYPHLITPKKIFKLEKEFPFLENFLADAEKFWLEGRTRRLKSGFWIESGATGKDIALEATVVSIAQNKLLLIELARYSYDEKLSLIQKGRQLRLDYGRMERQEKKLRAARDDSEERVKQEILERKLAEQERNLLAMAIDQAAEIFLITNTNGVIQYVNPAFELITGYKRTEALGMKPSMLQSGEHDKIFYRKLWETLKEGKAWRSHMINKRKDGSPYEVEAIISPMRDASGNIINYAAVQRDVTHEVMMQKQLRQTLKMEALGTLAGGVAHDFNNILAGVLGYTEMALATTDPGSKMHTWLDRAVSACMRGKELVDQILTFSHYSDQERSPIFIKTIIKESLKLLRATIPTTIEIRQNINPSSGLVTGDATEIHQVLMNLCTNAAYAMRKTGGILEVTLQNVNIETEDVVNYMDLSPGPYVKLTVSDTGDGIDSKTVEKIFDPFFTTKKKGRRHRNGTFRSPWHR